jgi:predicted MFS family arabinose efflux permease
MLYACVFDSLKSPAFIQPEDAPLARQMSYAYLLLATICLTYFVENFLRSAAGALTPILIGELGISHGSMGLLISAFFFVYGVMQIPSGILSDALGARRTILGFTALTVVGVFLFWLSRSYSFLGLAQLMVGVGCSVFYINAVKLISTWFPAERKATAIGVLSAASGLGNFVAYMGFPLAVERLGDWRPLYLGMSVLLVANWAMNFRVLRGNGSTQVDGPHTRVQPIMRTLLATLADSRLLPFIAGYVLASFSWVFLSWMPQYLIDTKGFTYVDAGMVASVGSIAGIPGCIVVAAISDRLRRRKLPIVAFSAAYAVLLFIFLGLPGGLPLAVYLAVSFGLTFMVSFWVLFFSMVPETLPPDRVGIGLGLVNGLGTIGFSVVAPVYGVLVDATGGYGASSMVLLGGAVAMTLIFALFLKECYGREPDE